MVLLKIKLRNFLIALRSGRDPLFFNILVKHLALVLGFVKLHSRRRKFALFVGRHIRLQIRLRVNFQLFVRVGAFALRERWILFVRLRSLCRRLVVELQKLVLSRLELWVVSLRAELRLALTNFVFGVVVLLREVLWSGFIRLTLAIRRLLISWEGSCCLKVWLLCCDVYWHLDPNKGLNRLIVLPRIVVDVDDWILH